MLLNYEDITWLILIVHFTLYAIHHWTFALAWTSFCHGNCHGSSWSPKWWLPLQLTQITRIPRSCTQEDLRCVCVMVRHSQHNDLTGNQIKITSFPLISRCWHVAVFQYYPVYGEWWLWNVPIKIINQDLLGHVCVTWATNNPDWLLCLFKSICATKRLIIYYVVPSLMNINRALLFQWHRWPDSEHLQSR